MPVSVELKADGKLISPGLWGLLDYSFRFWIRTQGMEAEINGTLRDLIGGLTTFFSKPPKMKHRPQRLKKASMKQEQKSAEALGGRRQSGSGARPGHKGDGRVRGRYRIENKFTTAASFRVKHAELQKARAECAGLEVPVFDVQFKEKGTLRTTDNWVLVPRDHFERLANAQASDD